jgi:hypothetical protein
MGVAGARPHAVMPHCKTHIRLSSNGLKLQTYAGMGDAKNSHIWLRRQVFCVRRAF